MGVLNSLHNIFEFIKPILDIGILTFLLYKAYELITRTNGMQIIKAAILLVIAYAVVWALNLKTMLWIFNLITPSLIISFVIVFQPEIRKLFLKLGQGDWFSFGNKSKHTYVNEVLKAAEILSEQKRGMLTVFLRNTKLNNVIDTGEHLDAKLSSSLLVTIFGHDTPLHDGACFIQDGKIIAAGCFLPLSEQYDIKKTFGTRHRAALGICEVSDCVVLVVSEESGAISLAYDSKLHYDLSMDQLTRILESLLEIKPDVQKIEDKADDSTAVS